MRALIVLPLLAGGLLLFASAASARQQEQAAKDQQTRDETLRIVLDPTFTDWGQAEIAAQWLEAHGFAEDARSVREDKWRKFYREQAKSPEVSGHFRVVGALSYPTGAAAKEIIRRTMREFKRGTLTSHGRPVTNRKQAIAMALNMARRRVGAEIGFLPDAPTLLSLLKALNRQLPEVGWWWLTPQWWWTLGVTPAGGTTQYQPLRYLSDADAAEWAMNETERAWNSSVQRWKWTGAAWQRA